MTEKEIQKIIDNIASLKVQGNTNIAKTVAKTLLEYISEARPHELAAFFKKTKEYGKQLAHARDNEPLAVNAVAFITKNIEQCSSVQEARKQMIDRIENFFTYIDESYETIRVNAFNILKGFSVFYTHCHSSLARDVLIRVAQSNENVLVINDETRPRYQGRITASKLVESGVRVLHTVDSAVASIFLDTRYETPEAVVVGSDGITVDGDLVNKVGTLNIAVAAKEAKIPFYVVTQSMKIDLRSAENVLPIEQRDPDEIWSERPEQLEVLNPAFDLIPANYITGGYITERGLMKPDSFKNMITK